MSFTIYDTLGNSKDKFSKTGSQSCNVFGINLHGDLLTYIPATGTKDDPESNEGYYGDVIGSEDIVYSVNQAGYDDEIKAIVLEIDSFGGYPVAGEEVAIALRNSSKPTVAIIRQSGLSAAYLAASGADYIFASRNSDVGSIGVTASYLEEINDDKRYIQLSAGKYKDTGNPEKPITEEEKSLIMRDLKIVHQNFIHDVAKYRNLSADEVGKIADGSSVLGEKAKELGLIDDVGSWPEAEAYISEVIGERVSICW